MAKGHRILLHSRDGAPEERRDRLLRRRSADAQTISTGTASDSTASGRHAPSPQARYVTRTRNLSLSLLRLPGDGEREICFEGPRHQPVSSSCVDGQRQGRGREISSKVNSDPLPRLDAQVRRGPAGASRERSRCESRRTPFPPRTIFGSTATPSTRTGESPASPPHLRRNLLLFSVSVLELEQRLQREEPRLRAVRRARHEPARPRRPRPSPRARERGRPSRARAARGPAPRRRRPTGPPCRRGRARWKRSVSFPSPENVKPGPSLRRKRARSEATAGLRLRRARSRPRRGPRRPRGRGGRARETPRPRGTRGSSPRRPSTSARGRRPGARDRPAGSARRRARPRGSAARRARAPPRRSRTPRARSSRRRACRRGREEFVLLRAARSAARDGARRDSESEGIFLER